jgi:hypothetical protein
LRITPSTNMSFEVDVTEDRPRCGVQSDWRQALIGVSRNEYDVWVHFPLHKLSVSSRRKTENEESLYVLEVRYDSRVQVRIHQSSTYNLNSSKVGKHIRGLASMVRFAPFLFVTAPAVVAFQAPRNNARASFRPIQAATIGTESFTPTTSKPPSDAGSMIDLTGVSFSVSFSNILLYCTLPTVHTSSCI